MRPDAGQPENEPEQPDVSRVFKLGQLVGRTGRADVGVVVGFIFRGPERAIVQWADGCNIEALDSLVEVHQPSASERTDHPRWS
jgi:hypothetical protein